MGGALYITALNYTIQSNQYPKASQNENLLMHLQYPYD
jgi:hypothetical protein